MEATFNTPLRTTGTTMSLFGSTGPRSTVTSAAVDRYIPNRASQDNTLSHFLLTTKENMSPMSILHASPQREDSVASSSVLVSSPLPFRAAGGGGGLIGTYEDETGLPMDGTFSPPPFCYDGAGLHGDGTGFNSLGAGASGGRGGRGIRSGRAGSPSIVTDIFAKLRLDASSSRPNASGRDPSHTPSSNTASPLVASFASPSEVEPYTTKLARALFSDAPQKTVLGVCSGVGGDGASGGMESGGGGGGRAAAAAGGLDGTSENARYSNSLGVVFEANRARNFKSKSFRLIAQTPERILDASNIIDDFYLNLMDCSSTDVLCVALQSTIYLWHSASRFITQLPSTYEQEGGVGNIVCGVSWAPDGRHLAVGLNSGKVDVWDVEAEQIVRQWHHHSSRVGSLSWTGNGALLASGSKDTTVRVQDIREYHRGAVGGGSGGAAGGGGGGGPAYVLRAHTQEVCGLRWSPNCINLASGGNDNQLLIWDRRSLSSSVSAASVSSLSASAMGAAHRVGARGEGSGGGSGAFGLYEHLQSRPVLYLNKHTAAVKALAWNPAQPSLLVSGGGTDDRTLRFWDVLTGECVQQVDTQSQVCGVLWNRNGTELVSSHGFSLNQLTLWKYPSLRRVADLTGHTSRVLHLCISADREVVISAAGDETIRFWRCFLPAEQAGGGTPAYRDPAVPTMRSSTSTAAGAVGGSRSARTPASDFHYRRGGVSGSTATGPFMSPGLYGEAGRSGGGGASLWTSPMSPGAAGVEDSSFFYQELALR